jgi:hypothetical protein
MADSAWWVARVLAAFARVALACVPPLAAARLGAIVAFAVAGLRAAFARAFVALGVVVAEVGIWRGLLFFLGAGRNGYGGFSPGNSANIRL